MSNPNSANAAQTLASVDPIWQSVRAEADMAVQREAAMSSLIYGTVISAGRLDDAIIERVAERLHSRDIEAGVLTQNFREIFAGRPELGRAFRADLAAVYDRDPACARYIEPLLYFKGFHALVVYRFAHTLWNDGRRDFAYWLQSQSSRAFSVDIHPAATIGIGIMIDHGHGIVFGETSRVGDNVSFLHGVTLGGTGKESGDRHPNIGNNVLIGAGAKVLGNITVGDCSRVAAGSVVLKDVPACTTVAGVPAKIMGPAGCPEPARTMEHRF